MINPYVAVLDTCVLAPMPVADTLLRLAEEPAFYAPKWSPDILAELERTLLRFGYSADQAKRRISTMEGMFPEALVTGYESFLPVMRNDEKDRSVLAAAVKCGAHAIVSDNRRHFPKEALCPYNLECLTADEFLEHQYHLDPDAFISILMEQASQIRLTLPQLLARHVPSLSRVIVIK